MVDGFNAQLKDAHAKVERLRIALRLVAATESTQSSLSVSSDAYLIDPPQMKQHYYDALAAVEQRCADNYRQAYLVT